MTTIPQTRTQPLKGIKHPWSTDMILRHLSLRPKTTENSFQNLCEPYISFSKFLWKLFSKTILKVISKTPQTLCGKPSLEATKFYISFLKFIGKLFPNAAWKNHDKSHKALNLFSQSFGKPLPKHSIFFLKLILKTSFKLHTKSQLKPSQTYNQNVNPVINYK